MARSDEEKAARKAARDAATARNRDRRAAAKATLDAAEVAKRFNPRSTRSSVAESLKDSALTLEEYRAAEQHPNRLVGSAPEPTWHKSYDVVTANERFGTTPGTALSGRSTGRAGLSHAEPLASTYVAPARRRDEEPWETDDAWDDDSLWTPSYARYFSLRPSQRDNYYAAWLEDDALDDDDRPEWELASPDPPPRQPCIRAHRRNRRRRPTTVLRDGNTTGVRPGYALDFYYDRRDRRRHYRDDRLAWHYYWSKSQIAREERTPPAQLEDSAAALQREINRAPEPQPIRQPRSELMQERLAKARGQIET
jgi:hypothetical protein